MASERKEIMREILDKIVSGEDVVKLRNSSRTSWVQSIPLRLISIEKSGKEKTFPKIRFKFCWT